MLKTLTLPGRGEPRLPDAPAPFHATPPPARSPGQPRDAEFEVAKAEDINVARDTRARLLWRDRVGQQFEIRRLAQ